MYVSAEWLEDFLDTSENLQQDILLLEALTLRAEQRRVETPILWTAFHRLLDYLSQHAGELRCLEDRLTPPAPPAAQ